MKPLTSTSLLIQNQAKDNTAADYKQAHINFKLGHCVIRMHMGLSITLATG